MRTILGISLLLCAIAVRAQTLPSGFYDSVVVNNLSQPDAITFTPDGRLLICEKTGALKSFNGTTLTTELTLHVSTESERGLLGIALDPSFASNHYIYLYYTTNTLSLNAPPTPKNRVSRFSESGGVINASTEKVILDLIASDAGNHNGGCLRFAADGKLYISTGDGGSNHLNSQDLNSLSGKILRINRDGTIPTDNPFYGQSGKRAEIFCYGLRNPFRFNVRPGTSTFLIGDVGENTWEEVDLGASGANYGWPYSEGPDNVTGYTAPIFYYQHTSQSAAIIGGCFMNSVDFPQGYYGNYVYGDYVLGAIGWLTITSTNAVTANGPFEGAPSPVDFYMGTHGGLYYASVGNGEVHVIAYAPVITGFVPNVESVVGGKNPYLTVSLDNPAPVGGLRIGLSSSDPNVITVPTAVKIPANTTSANYYVVTHPVSTPKTITISANDGTSPHTAFVQVVPPHLVGFSVAPTSMSSGGYSTGTVYLDGNAPAGGISFSDSSDQSGVASVTGSGVVAAGSNQATIRVTAGLVNSTQSAHITVSSGGYSKTVLVNVTPNPSVAGIAPESHTLAAGQQMFVTVALAKTWTSPITVNLSTDNPSALSVPPSVTIPAGRIANAVKVTGLSVSQNTFVHVYATLGNVVRSNYITVTP